MNRDVTNRLNQFLDEWVPPRIRDSKFLVKILFRIVIGKEYKHYMEFKEKLPYLKEKDINQYYEKLNKTFIKRETNCNKACIERIIKEAEGNRILDVAAGKGYMAKTLYVKNPELECTVCDIVIPDKKEQVKGINYVRASITNLPFEDASFDTVICTHVLEHIKDNTVALKEIRRVCKKKLIIVLPRQREYLYTYDLHMKFFPYQYNVECFLNEGSKGRINVELLSNDWMYIEELNDSISR